MPGFSSDQIRCSLVQDVKIHKNPQFVLNRADGTKVEDIDIGQKDWPYRYPKTKKRFSWSFIDHTPDMRAKVQRVAIQEAFNSIQKITKLKIDYKRNPKKKTDITVEWLEDIESFDSNLTVLAHAYLYHPHGSKNGVMEFNDSLQSRYYFTPLGWPVEAYLVDAQTFHKGQTDNRGNLIMLSSQPVVKIAMHEFGHILGLSHDIIHSNSLMYPSITQSYDGDNLIKKSFYWDDITSIPRLTKSYGSSNIFQRWLDRWRTRRTRRSTYTRYQKKIN